MANLMVNLMVPDGNVFTFFALSFFSILDMKILQKQEGRTYYEKMFNNIRRKKGKTGYN